MSTLDDWKGLRKNVNITAAVKQFLAASGASR
jgi:hypothetical protein